MGGKNRGRADERDDVASLNGKDREYWGNIRGEGGHLPYRRKLPYSPTATMYFVWSEEGYLNYRTQTEPAPIEIDF